MDSSSMTADQIDDMTPDALNRWIAEREGWRVELIDLTVTQAGRDEVFGIIDPDGCLIHWSYYLEPDSPWEEHGPQYAHSADAAIALCERLGMEWQLTALKDKNNAIVWPGTHEFIATADTPAHALTKAAAKWMERDAA